MTFFCQIEKQITKIKNIFNLYNIAFNKKFNKIYENPFHNTFKIK